MGQHQLLKDRNAILLIRPGQYMDVTCYSIIKKGVENKVRFITRNTAPGTYTSAPIGVMDYVLSLPCTADQCFLTGYAAVPLYDTLTARHLMIDWITNSQEKCRDYVHGSIRQSR